MKKSLKTIILNRLDNQINELNQIKLLINCLDETNASEFLDNLGLDDETLEYAKYRYAKETEKENKEGK